MENQWMSENKFYIPIKDPFDNKRGTFWSRDIKWILKGKVETLSEYTIIDTKCNNFLICNYLDLPRFKFRENIPLNKDIKDFCKKNNIKIVICFSRETVRSEKRFNSDDWYWMFNGCVSEERVINFSFFDHSYAIGRWKHCGTLVNNVEKTKKFSIVLGMLNNAPRLWWCVKLIHDNLHNHSDIIFSKIVSPLKKDYVLDFVNKHNIFKRDEYLLDTFKKNKNYVQQDTFVENDLNIERLYERGREWIIPDEVASTLINIVFETRPYDWGYSSLTEKMWKPIIAGMPFLWVSFRYTKPYLEKKGYKFYNFINYAFDSIERDSKRYKAAYEEFKRLNAFSFDELKAMIDNEKHIAEHNKKVFYGIDYDKRLMNVFSSIK